MKRNKKGFTIVELVIVIAVIAILAAVLIPTFSSVIDNANKSSALQEGKAALDIVSMLETDKQANHKMQDGKYYFVNSKKTGEKDYVCCYDAKAAETFSVMTYSDAGISSLTKLYDNSNNADLGDTVVYYKSN